MGYLVRCIQNRYFESEAVAVVEGSHEKATVINALHEAANSEETKKRVWESTKKKEDFVVFLAFEENEKGISFMELDEILPPAEAVDEYISWVKAGRP